MSVTITTPRPSTILNLQLNVLDADLQATRRRFYCAASFMCGPHTATLMGAIEANDLDTAQIIWEKHTGLTGP